LLPKSNTALVKEGLNQGSPQDTSHLPREGSRSLRLSTQVGLQTASKTVAFFTVTMSAGPLGEGGKGIREPRGKQTRRNTTVS